MKRKLPKRYISEQAVKRALKIDSFRNLSKDKIMQFASMIPYMDREVAIAIINQFPVLADFGKVAISTYMQMCDGILEKSKESQMAVIQGYQTILDSLSKKMDVENISEEERKSLTEDMISVADKIAEADLQYKKFLDRQVTKVVIGILGIAALVGAGIGINSAFGGTSGLPQIEDDEEIEGDDDEEDLV